MIDRAPEFAGISANCGGKAAKVKSEALDQFKYFHVGL